MNLTKKVAKQKKVTLAEIANKMEITAQALGQRLKASKLETLIQVSKYLKCDIHELIDCGPGFAHFYDPETGEWLGIRKK